MKSKAISSLRILLVIAICCSTVAIAHADQFLVGNDCVRCIAFHLTPQHPDFWFNFTLTSDANATGLYLGWGNSPDTIATIELTGPNNLDLMWEEKGFWGTFITFNEFFPAGTYQVLLHNVAGVTGYEGGGPFTNFGCCGTVNTEAQLWLTGTPVPEPASVALFGSGVLGLAGVLRRKSKM
jgi:hypothetical protein